MTADGWDDVTTDTAGAYAAAVRWLGLDAAERAIQGPRLVATACDSTRELATRLERCGYPVSPLVTAGGSPSAAVAEFGAVGFDVPPALAALWGDVGSISFVDMASYRHTSFWDTTLGRGGEALSCDGLVVDGPTDDGWIDYAVDWLHERPDGGGDAGLPIAPDALHKDDVSGGGPYELVPHPDDPWMASLRGFTWAGPSRPISAPPGSAPDLLSYLRTTVLECAGFPGLLGSSAFEPLRAELVVDLPVF